MSASTKNIENQKQAVKVFIRIRPFFQNETGIQAFTSTDVVLTTGQSEFHFDHVFNSECTQASVYNLVIKSLIADVISGYHCTIMTYGQSSTGKTFTMNGVSDNNSNNIVGEESGLISRAASELFQTFNRLKQECTVVCSYFELCNEELRDYLCACDSSNQIRIYDDKDSKGSLIIQGVERVNVTNEKEVFTLLAKSQNCRKPGSHTIFTINVHVQGFGRDSEVIKMGKISFVDLAGSFASDKSGSAGHRGKSSGNPSQSLLTLGRVIKALSEKKCHVPFRESKLTRILQNCLGGHAKLSIVGTIAPSITNIDETISTLQFAQMARNVVNKPEVNKQISFGVLLNRYHKENIRLRKDLKATRTASGVHLRRDEYDKLLKEMVEEKERKIRLKEELLEKTGVIEQMNIMVQEDCEGLETELENHKQIFTQLEGTLASLNNVKTDMCNKISETVYNILQITGTRDNLFEVPFSKEKKLVENLKMPLVTHINNHEQLLVPVQQCNLKSEHFEIENDYTEINVDERVQTFVSETKRQLDCIDSTLLDKRNGEFAKITSDRYLSAINTIKNVDVETKQDLQGIALSIETIKEKLEDNKVLQAKMARKIERVSKLVRLNWVLDLQLERSDKESFEEAFEKNAKSLTPGRYPRSFTNRCTTSSQHRGILQESITRVFQTVDDEFEKVQHSAFRLHEDTHINLTEDEVGVEVIPGLVKDFHEHSQKHNTTVLSEVQNLQAELTHTHTSIAEVKHAGDTPIRTSYKYPHLLKDLTPKEKLLSRFREKENDDEEVG